MATKTDIDRKLAYTEKYLLTELRSALNEIYGSSVATPTKTFSQLVALIDRTKLRWGVGSDDNPVILPIASKTNYRFDDILLSVTSSSHYHLMLRKIWECKCDLVDNLNRIYHQKDIVIGSKLIDSGELLPNKVAINYTASLMQLINYVRSLELIPPRSGIWASTTRYTSYYAGDASTRIVVSKVFTGDITSNTTQVMYLYNEVNTFPQMPSNTYQAHNAVYQNKHTTINVMVNRGTPVAITSGYRCPYDINISVQHGLCPTYPCNAVEMFTTVDEVGTTTTQAYRVLNTFYDITLKFTKSLIINID